MLRIRQTMSMLATLVVVTVAAASPSQAALIQLFAPGDVSGETFNYPIRPGAGIQPVVASPFVLPGATNVLTFINSVGSFVRMDEEPSVPGGGGWTGGFPDGTRLLYTGNGAGVGSGPITVGFAIPVLEFGLLSQHNLEGLGLFTFMVFNGATLLGSFNVAADLPGFLGARATGGDAITHFIISGAVLDSVNDFAIGPVRAEAVPEPSTIVLFALAGAATALRKVRQGPRRKSAPGDVQKGTAS
jgi:hypothetical protein